LTFDKIQDGGGRHFEITLLTIISVATAHTGVLDVIFNHYSKFGANDIRTKFAIMTKNNVPDTILPPDFTIKIQDGGFRHFKFLFHDPSSSES